MKFRGLSLFSVPLLASASALLLSGCATNPSLDSGWMPRGYTYQDNTPLSSPAPAQGTWSKGAVITNTDKMADATAAWQGAMFELIAKMEPSLPHDGTPIMVMAKPPYTSQDIAFDHYLRQALMQKGQNITTAMGNALVLEFDSAPLSDGAALKTAQTEAGYQYVKGGKLEGIYLLQTVLKSVDGKVIKGKAATTAILPYEKSSGMSWGLPTGDVTATPSSQHAPYNQ